MMDLQASMRGWFSFSIWECSFRAERYSWRQEEEEEEDMFG